LVSTRFGPERINRESSETGALRAHLQAGAAIVGGQEEKRMGDSFSVYLTRVFGNDRYELSRFHSLTLLILELRRAEDLVEYPYTTCFIRFAYKQAMVNWPKGDFEFSFSDGANWCDHRGAFCCFGGT
jgi:hypothetical protein